MNTLSLSSSPRQQEVWSAPASMRYLLSAVAISISSLVASESIAQEHRSAATETESPMQNPGSVELLECLKVLRSDADRAMIASSLTIEEQMAYLREWMQECGSESFPVRENATHSAVQLLRGIRMHHPKNYQGIVVALQKEFNRHRDLEIRMRFARIYAAANMNDGQNESDGVCDDCYEEARNNVLRPWIMGILGR